jgi:spore germination protein YaaH
VNVTRRCDLCNTVLEFTEGNKSFAFNAHRADFCRAATLDRIRGLERAIEGVHENYRHAVARYTRSVDEHLAKEGVETLTERAARAELRAAVLKSHAETLTISPEDFKL